MSSTDIQKDNNKIIKHLKDIKNTIYTQDDHISYIGFTLKFLTKAQLSRLLFSIIFLFISMQINAISSQAAGQRNPNIKIQNKNNTNVIGQKLPDFGHDIIAIILQYFISTDHITYQTLPDQLLLIISNITIFFILLHPRRFLIIRRVCLILGFLNILRAYTVIITTLPDASPVCQNQPDKFKIEPTISIILYRAYLFIIEPGQHLTCGDMIFSGHTTVLIMCSCIFNQYCCSVELGFIRSNKWKYIRRIVYLSTVFGCFVILSTRLHQTLDISIAIFITNVVWKFQHNYIILIRLKVDIKVWRKRDILDHIIKWLEAEEMMDIDDKAQDKYKNMLKKQKID